MNLEVYALSNVGLKRTENQDNYYCNGICPSINDSGYRYSKTIGLDNPSLYAVFDGMGGHVHGERASQIAVEEADKAFRIYQQGEAKPLLYSICTSANNRICDEIIHVVKGRMGSTAAMMLFENNQYHLCNLGDSSIFLIRNNTINTISYEHSERQNYEEIFGKNYDPTKKFKLTQHLGIFPDEMEITPYYTYGMLNEGDIFVLCSDGLTDMVSKQEILEVLSKNSKVKTATEELLALALKNGGKDNITIVVCKVIRNSTVTKPIGESLPEKQIVDSNTKKSSGKVLAIVFVCVVIVSVIAGILLFSNGSKDETEDGETQTPTISETAVKETKNISGSTVDEAAPSTQSVTTIENTEDNLDATLNNETTNDMQ